MRRVVAVPLVAVLLAGCGGDSAPTREEFIATADERCRRVLRENPSREIGPNDSSAEIYHKYQQQVSFYQRLATDLQDLEAPDDLESQFRDYMEKTRQQADNRRSIAEAHRAGDLARFRALRQEFVGINDAKSGMRRAIGFKAC